MIEAEQIKSNFDKHLRIVDSYISSPRKEQAVEMINQFSENYIFAPASSKSWYHNAFPGGYVDHVNRVVKIALKQKTVYEELSQMPSDFTQEELVFASLFHDLGKLGTPDNPGYIQQTDKWRQDKLS
jgi:response regulator RpfG family c-di-GMP phosphodiesterase